MELKILKGFVYVAREGSISRAAKFLHITQPCLSRQIMDLEAELGVKLFHRAKRRLELTEHGITLRKRAEQMLELERIAIGEMSVGSQPVAGTIRIGAGEGGSFRILASELAELMKSHEHLNFALFSGNGEDVVDRLDRGLLDFALVIDPFELADYGHLALWRSETWGLLIRKDHALAEKDMIEAHDLKALPLICSRQALDGGLLGDWLGSDLASLDIVGTYNLLFNAALMVEAGAGAAICLADLFNTSGTLLRFMPLKPTLESRTRLIWKKPASFPAAATFFLKRIMEIAAAHGCL